MADARGQYGVSADKLHMRNLLEFTGALETGESRGYLSIRNSWWLLIGSFRPLRVRFGISRPREARGLDPYPDPDPVDQRENNGEEVGAIELGDYHWMNRKDRILEHFPKAVTVLSHFGRRSVGVWSSPIPHVRVYCAASEPEVAVTLRNLPCVEKLGYLTPSQRGWAVLKHSNAAAQNPGGRPLVLAHLRKLGLVWFQGSVESLKELCILAPRGFPNLGALELVFGSMKFNNWNWEHVRRALCRLVRGMDGKLKLVVARVAPGDDVEEYKREMEKLKKDLTDAGVRCVVLEEIRVTAYHFESETYC